MVCLIPLFTIPAFASSHPEVEVEPPLKQVANNIPANEVICQEGLELIFKAADGSPACVKPETAIKLVERGWAELKLAPQKEEFNFGKTRNEILFSISEVRKAHGFEIEFDKDLTSQQKEGAKLFTYKLIHEKDGWVGDLTFYSGKSDAFHPSSFGNIFQAKFFISTEQGVTPSSTWEPFLKSVISPLVPEWNSLNPDQIPAQWIENILNNMPPDDDNIIKDELKSASNEIMFSYQEKKLGFAELIITKKI